MTTTKIRAIDPWVNLSMLGGQPAPAWLVRVKDDYFKAGEDFLKELSAEELIAQMDEAGVERACSTNSSIRTPNDCSSDRARRANPASAPVSRRTTARGSSEPGR
jgi:hypothetical protein